jgi:hypothetical protein
MEEITMVAKFDWDEHDASLHSILSRDPAHQEHKTLRTRITQELTVTGSFALMSKPHLMKETLSLNGEVKALQKRIGRKPEPALKSLWVKLNEQLSNLNTLVALLEQQEEKLHQRENKIAHPEMSVTDVRAEHRNEISRIQEFSAITLGQIQSSVNTVEESIKVLKKWLNIK